MKSELTPRQWALYNFLKDRGDQWTTQLEAAAYICQSSDKKGENEYYGCWNGDPKEFHDSAARLQMTDDIRAINDSNVIQKIIISSYRGIKIANEEEFERYIKKEISAAVRRLMRAKRKATKGSRNNQMRFVFNKERDTIKSFIDSDKNFGARLKAIREARGLYQQDVIRLIRPFDKSFDAPMLSKIEKGYCLPNKHTLTRLADIYGIEPLILQSEEIPLEDILKEIRPLASGKKG